MGLGCETKIDETATPFSLWMCANVRQVKYEQKSNLCEQWDLFWLVSLLLLGCVPIRLRHPLSYPGTFDWDPMLDKCGWKDTDGNGITGNDGNGNVESGDDFMGKAIIQKAKLQISHLTAVKKDIGAGLAGGSRSWATQWRWRWGGGSRWRGGGSRTRQISWKCWQWSWWAATTSTSGSSGTSRTLAALAFSWSNIFAKMVAFHRHDAIPSSWCHYQHLKHLLNMLFHCSSECGHLPTSEWWWHFL